MAIFTSSITAPINGLGLDMYSYNAADLFAYLNRFFSFSQIRYFDDANNETVFNGSGFAENAGTGAIIAGTITDGYIKENGVILLAFTGANIAAADLYNAAAANDTYLFLSLLAGGDDTITGTAFDDSLFFGDNPGNDTMNGGAGFDDLVGGIGNDTLNGEADGDWLVGGDGNDIINGGNTGDDYDTLAYSEEYLYYGGTQGVTVNLSSVTQGGVLSNQATDAYGDTDTVSGIESVRGTGLADTVYSRELVQRAFEFAGFAGADTFVGTANGYDRLRYERDEHFAQQSNQQRGTTLVAGGITVNFAADANGADGANGTITDSFGATDTVSGVDSVRGTFFVDTFNGGAANEEFQGLKGADIINGGGGFDVASYRDDRFDNRVQAGGLAGINANFAGDTLANGISVGTVVDGFGATDQLTNIEAIDGTDFNDTMTGGADRVEFWGNQGTDTLTGGSADDFLDGGDGTDSLTGGDGRDEMRGGNGTDTLYGGLGDDNLRGDEGGSFDQGNDQLFGEGGDDSFKGGWGADLINGGADRDRVEYNLETTFTGDDATHGVIVNLTTAALANVSVTGIANTTVAAGTAIDTRNFVDTLVSIENVQGTGYQDLIVAGAGANGLQGFEGNDTLRGGADNDWLSGGQGDDTLDGGTGGDDFDVLNYTDEYLWNGGTQGVTVNMSAVTQVGLLSGRAIDSYGTTDTVSNFERVEGTGFGDTVYAQELFGRDFEFEGYAGNDVFVGTQGGVDRLNYKNDERYALDVFQARGIVLTAGGISVNFSGDTIFGNGASGTIVDSFGFTDTVSFLDTVHGTFFNDVFQGGVDNERFAGLKGQDNINGGGGFDVAAYYDDEFDNGVQPGGGAGIFATFAGDTVANGISVGTVTDGFGTVDTLTNIEAIAGTWFNDTMIGGADKVEFWGDRGEDTLTGGSANDYLDGGADNDTLTGGSGADELYGGDNMDSLTGGAGGDRLDGGEDIDTARYSTSGAGVTINLTTNTASGGDATGDTLFSIESLIGSIYADTLTGHAEFNQLEGGDGDDYIDGMGGNDVIFGGVGNDTIVFNTGLLAANVNGGAGGTDRLLVINGTLPTSFNLVTAGMETARWQQTDTGGNSWTTIVNNYTSSWGIIDSTTTYDNNRVRVVDYDQAAQYWSTLTQDFNAAGQRDAYYYNYDDGRLAHTTVDLTGAAIYWTTLEQRYNAAGQRTSFQYNYDDGRIAYTDKDWGVGPQNLYWDTLEQRFNAAAQRTEFIYTWDNGTIVNTLEDRAGANWQTLEQTFNPLGQRTQFKYVWDTGAISITDEDRAGQNWASLTQNFRAGDGARTDYNYIFDNGTKQVVRFDVDNLYTWNTETANYDAGGNLINIFYT